MHQKVAFRLFLGSMMLLFMSSLVRADFKEIEVRVLPESIVYDGNYTLGEIAEFDGFDIETIQQAAKIRIGRSPQPGRSRLVSKNQIISHLKSKFNIEKFKVTVPLKALVSRASLKISKNQLRNIILEEINKRYKNYDDVKITLKSKLKDVYIPKGSAAYKIKRIGKSEKIAGNSSWMLCLSLDNKEVKKILIRAKIDVIGEVLVAKGNIRKGEKIEENDLIKVKKDISKERKGFVTSNTDVIGKNARRNIYQNEYLKPNLVERPVLIEKGSAVKVIFQTDNIFLTNTAQALKSGRKGDLIPVRTLNNKKTIYAVVKDDKNVHVEL